MHELAPGIFTWAAPHPEYRPKAEEVEAYALVAGGSLLLADPLLPQDEQSAAAVLADLDALAAAARRVDIVITVPYHTRSAEPLWRRYAAKGPAAIWGHAHVARRLTQGTPLEVVPRGAAGTAAPIAGGAAEAYTIGRPRRDEHPVYVPALRAVVFGDAVVGTAQGIRFWILSEGTGERWYHDVFAPTLAPLAGRDVEHVLVTHGPPAIGGGRRALAECLAAAPVKMY